VVNKLVFGFVISIKSDQFLRIFEKNLGILILSSQRKQLRSGTKLIFYNPIPISAVTGEAIITEISFAKADEIIKQCNETVQSMEELIAYFEKSKILYSKIKTRKENDFMLIKFQNPTKFSKPKKLNRQMVPSGFYITEEEYNSLFM